MNVEVPEHHQMFVNARAVLWREGVDGIEYLVQTRDRPGQRRSLEFPGGTVETNEPLHEALRREVREETGLEVIEIEGKAVLHEGESRTVECVEPFAAYQMTNGFNSVGVYFRCRAEGELLTEGDGSRDIRWMSTAELSKCFAEDPNQFHEITAAVLSLMQRKGMIPGAE